MDLLKLSAAEIARRVRRNEWSPTDVLELHLDRIERVQPPLNAFVHVDPEKARTEARGLEARLKSNEPLPLAGVPVSIKSSIDVAGLRSEAGSRLRRCHLAEQDAPLVARLRSAGAIILGTTNTPEFLMAYETDNLLYGRTNNPWNMGRTPGGSSGGEAAAIAAGCSVAGIGSDGGGSIRLPAHFSGICGLKPTPGRVPGTGHFPACVGPFAHLGVVGPMARSVEDLRLMLEAIAGPDDGDVMSAGTSPVRLKPAKPGAIRIACFDDDGGAAVPSETRAAVRSAADALADAGLHPEGFLPAGLAEAWEHWFTIFCLAGNLLVRAAAANREDELSPILRQFLEFAAEQPPLDVEKLLDTLCRRDLLRARFLAQMQRYPVLLTPVSSVTAFRHGEAAWGPGRAVDYLDSMRFTQWFNLLGLPAVVVPVACSSDGLPIGVQLVGRPYEEETLLNVASLLEQKFGRQEPRALGTRAATI